MAFGLYNLVTGAALFVASAIAGSLWTALGPAATFQAGAVFAGLATVGTLACRPRLVPNQPVDERRDA